MAWKQLLLVHQVELSTPDHYLCPGWTKCYFADEIVLYWSSRTWLLRWIWQVHPQTVASDPNTSKELVLGPDLCSCLISSPERPQQLSLLSPNPTTMIFVPSSDSMFNWKVVLPSRNFPTTVCSVGVAASFISPPGSQMRGDCKLLLPQDAERVASSNVRWEQHYLHPRKLTIV